MVAEQRPDASEEDSFQWMSRVLQVDPCTRVDGQGLCSLAVCEQIRGHQQAPDGRSTGSLLLVGTSLGTSAPHKLFWSVLKV